MKSRPDIRVNDRQGRTIALVEVKRVRGYESSDARTYFQNHYDAGILEGASYFVLITADTVFLWNVARRPGRRRRFADPTLQVVLPRHLADRLPGKLLDDHTLSLAVLQWLLDVGENANRVDDPAERELRDAGFLGALEHAEFRLEEAP